MSDPKSWDSQYAEVKKQLDRIHDAIADLRAEEKMWLQRLFNLQNKCPHPKGSSYKDMTGVSCFYCPTCGMDR